MKQVKNNLFSVLLLAIFALSPALAGGFYPGPQPGGSSGGGSSTPAAVGTGETLESAATKITYTVTDDSAAISVCAYLVANGGTNNPFVTFNDDSAQTNYEQTYIYSIGGAVTYGQPANSSIFTADNLADGEVADGCLTVGRLFDGTNTRITATFLNQMPGAYLSGTISKTFSGDVALSAINIYSNQSNGLDVGSTIG